MSLRQSFALAGLATLVGFLVCACSSPQSIAVGSGSALDGGFTAHSTGGFSALRPGGEMAIMFVELHNRTDGPVTLRSITPYGKRLGLGSVINIRGVAIAPTSGVALGGYFTLPPTNTAPHSGACFVQTLRPVNGYTMRPGATTKVLEIVQGVAPGMYRQDGVVVNYRQGSTNLHQELSTTTINGSVKLDAREPSPKMRGGHCHGVRQLPDGPAT
jgi:hypothetical protein